MVLSGTGVLWFVQMLWMYSMLLALVRRAEKGRLYQVCGKVNVIVGILLVIPVYFSGLILNMPVVSVYRFGIYGFTFFLGYFVFAHDEVIERISRFRVMLILLSVMSAALYVHLHFGDNYAVMPVVGSISATVFAWSTVLAVLGGMKAWGDRKNRFTSFMAERSFGLYVFHYLPLSAAAYGMHNYMDVPEWTAYLLTGCAAFLGSLILYETVSRIPVIRWCVLGLKKEKRNVQR